MAPGSLPAARVWVWLGRVLWPSGYLFLCLVLLLFPDGRLPSRRWRPVAVVLAVSWTGVILDDAFAPVTTTVQDVMLTNPVAVEALAHPGWRAVAQGTLAVAFVSLGAAALAPLRRFRRADSVQICGWARSNGKGGPKPPSVRRPRTHFELAEGTSCSTKSARLSLGRTASSPRGRSLVLPPTPRVEGSGRMVLACPTPSRKHPTNQPGT